MHFCESCARWTRYPPYDRRVRRRGQHLHDPFGACALSDEPKLDVQLCGQHVFRIPITTQRRLREPPRRTAAPSLGHSFSSGELTCVNVPYPGGRRCGRHWKEHRKEPTQCRYPHRYERASDEPTVAELRAIRDAGKTSAWGRLAELREVLLG
jgi:hypothetical protein